MATEQNMLDALVQHQVYSYRASTAVVNELNKILTSEMNSTAVQIGSLLDELTDAEKEALVAGKYTTDTLKEIKSLMDELFTVVASTIPEAFATSAIALATYEAAYIAKVYGEEVAVSGKKIYDTIKAKPVTQGMLIADIWKNLASSTRDKVLYSVREGIEQGLTTSEIVNSIRGKRTKMANGKFEYVGGIIEEVRKRGIESNVRTIRSSIANESMRETFKALGFDYLKDVATLDGKTSPTCRVIDGRVQKIDKNTKYAPYHFQCRTIQVGCDKDGKISGRRPFVADTRSVKDIPKDQREDKIGQVNANTTYASFFKNQSAEFQKEVLGKTRYELYKKGEYSLDKFVDPLGKPYTLEELRKLDERTFKELGL